MVSILVPYLNSKNELARCIESVLRQTYGDFELLLLDNGSTDGSGEVAHSFTDERIRHFSDPKHDLASARNFLIREAKGEFLLFVDSDDYLKEDGLEILIRGAGEKEADFVAASYEYRGNSRETERRLPFFCTDDREEMHKFFLTHGRNFNHAWGKLYRKELFDGMTYPEGSHYEDIEMLPRLLEKTGRLLILNDVAYVYVKNGYSISYDSRLEVHMDGLKARMTNYDFYKKTYPGLIYPAAVAAYEFAFFFLGKIFVQGVESNGDLWQETIGMIKKLPYPKGKGTLKDRVARRLVLWTPKYAGKLFADYSKARND